MWNQSSKSTIDTSNTIDFRSFTLTATEPIVYYNRSFNITAFTITQSEPFIETTTQKNWSECFVATSTKGVSIINITLMPSLEATAFIISQTEPIVDAIQSFDITSLL